MRSRIYVGHVMHARRAPVEHGFRYPAFAFALELDELDELDRRLRLFARDRWALFALHEGDHLGHGRGRLRDKLAARIGAASADMELDRVTLVTTPRVAGHTFNPVSFYYCYDAGERLSGIVAEVNNTFGEGHTYVLPASNAIEVTEDRLIFVARKRFHVSPFNDMGGDYEFDFTPLDKTLDVRIDIRRETGKTFYSRLSGRARVLSDAALFRLAATYPLATALTLPRIMWQAFLLHYRKGLPVFRKPEPSSALTYAASRPPYISEFSAPTWLQRRAERKRPKENHGSH